MTAKNWTILGAIVGIIGLGVAVFALVNGGPSITASDNAQVQTGNGIQVTTDEDSPVTIDLTPGE